MLTVPQVSKDKNLQRLTGEYFLIEGIQCEFQIEFYDSGSKYSGKGSVVLTTHRLIFKNTEDGLLKVIFNRNFKTIEVPLSLIIKEKFKKPLIGHNYLSGQSSTGLKFKIWFIKGNGGTFVPAFNSLINILRHKGHNEVLREVESGQWFQILIKDPNDYCIIYNPPSNQSTQKSIPGIPQAQGYVSGAYIPQYQAETTNPQYQQGQYNYPSFEDINYDPRDKKM